ncbi:hypothetical protein PtrM4_023350 [Pyrenophora tritici-repentis]|uniref:Uncharacterized protein n=1 Tax=Pyrenophora tritici-repentis TaxID=45151 RepID=A0A834VVY0_9PLEO|nr:hypothetical protein PtrM4_023350 [Pyrenophora tritici-repentis]
MVFVSLGFTSTPTTPAAAGARIWRALPVWRCAVSIPGHYSMSAAAWPCLLGIACPTAWGFSAIFGDVCAVECWHNAQNAQNGC